MNSDDFGRMLESLAKGWTRADYDEVISWFTDDISYLDPTRYHFSDREQLLNFFRDDEGASQTCTFHRFVFDESRQVGAAEYSCSGSQIYHGTVWITLRNDRILEWREYQHTSDMSYKEFWKNT